MLRLILLLLAVACVFVVFTTLLHYISKNNKFVKYFPSIITLLIGIYFGFLAQASSTGFEDIGRAILAVMFLTSALSGVITALFIDYIVPRIGNK